MITWVGAGRAFLIALAGVFVFGVVSPHYTGWRLTEAYASYSPGDVAAVEVFDSERKLLCEVTDPGEREFVLREVRDSEECDAIHKTAYLPLVVRVTMKDGRSFHSEVYKIGSSGYAYVNQLNPDGDSRACCHKLKSACLYNFLKDRGLF